MTCAPISAISIVQTGPDRIRDKSTTNKSSRGFKAQPFMYFFTIPPWSCRESLSTFWRRDMGLLQRPAERCRIRYKMFHFWRYPPARMPANRSYQTLADQLLNTRHGDYASRRVQTRSGLEGNNLPGP